MIQPVVRSATVRLATVLAVDIFQVVDKDLFHVAEAHFVLGPLGPCQAGLNLGEVQFQEVGEEGFRRVVRAEEALGPRVVLHQLDLHLVPAGA